MDRGRAPNGIGHLMMEPTTVGSLWLENDLHENELEFESHKGKIEEKMSALLQTGFTRKSTRSEHVSQPLRRSFTPPQIHASNRCSHEERVYETGRATAQIYVKAQ